MRKGLRQRLQALREKQAQPPPETVRTMRAAEKEEERRARRAAWARSQFQRRKEREDSERRATGVPDLALVPRRSRQDSWVY